MYDTNYNKMIKKVLGLATSLGKVEYRVGENLVGLYKNQVMFGKIEHDNMMRFICLILGINSIK